MIGLFRGECSARHWPYAFASPARGRLLHPRLPLYCFETSPRQPPQQWQEDEQCNLHRDSESPYVLRKSPSTRLRSVASRRSSQNRVIRRRTHARPEVSKVKQDCSYDGDLEERTDPSRPRRRIVRCPKCEGSRIAPRCRSTPSSWLPFGTGSRPRPVVPQASLPRGSRRALQTLRVCDRRAVRIPR